MLQDWKKKLKKPPLQPSPMVSNVLTKVITDKSYNRKNSVLECFSESFLSVCFFKQSMSMRFLTQRTGVVQCTVFAPVDLKIKNKCCIFHNFNVAQFLVYRLYAPVLLNTINASVQIVTSCAP